jgi:hypothetical protein
MSARANGIKYVRTMEPTLIFFPLASKIPGISGSSTLSFHLIIVVLAAIAERS